MTTEGGGAIMGDFDRRSSPATGTPSGHVAGHVKPRSSLRSVRIQILVPVLVAAIGFAVLGLIQTNQALTEVDQADRAIALARATEPIGALAHAVAIEYVTVSDAAHRRAGTGADINAQRTETDAAREQFYGLIGSIRESAPALNPLVDAVDRTIRSLGTAREILAQAPDGSAEVR